ncbi:MAG TPA: serine hydrolase domain-containing protein, partial [Rudaea sp.]
MPTIHRLIVLLVLPLCCAAPSLFAKSPRAAAHPAAHAPAPARALVTNPPGDAQASVRDLSQWLDAVEQSGQVAGLAVAVVKDDKVLLQRGLGYADASTGAPVTVDTVFRLASLSKAFASALAAILVNDGVLGWDTHVAGVLPSFELKNVDASGKLTVRDILSQRVGLPHNTYDQLLEADEPYPVLVDKLKEVDMTCGVGDC